jgi:integrase
MARLRKGTPPTYRLHKPSGRAVATIDGKCCYLGPYDSPASKAEYARLIAEYAISGSATKPACDPAGITITELLAKFNRHAKVHYRKNGKLTNEYDAYRVLMRRIKPLYGHTRASDFGPLALKSLRQKLIEAGQVRSTVNKNVGRIKRIFKWAASEELIPASVYQAPTTVEGLRKGRCDCPESEPVKPVDVEIVLKTLPHLPQVTADMVRFQLLTGARPGEVCTLTPGNVDSSKDVWEFFVDGHKTEHHGHSRTIYIGPEAQKILQPYLARSAEQVCFSMAESLEQRRRMKAAVRRTPLSCGNRRGKRSMSDRKGCKPRRQPLFEFTEKSYYRAIQYACDAAFPAPPPLGQLPEETNAARLRRLTTEQQGQLKSWQREHRWFPNQLRHTRATDIRKIFGLEAARVVLGHAAANVTQIYAERDAEKAREVARAIG